MFEKSGVQSASLVGRFAQVVTLSAASFIASEQLCRAEAGDAPLPAATARDQAIPFTTTVERVAALKNIQSISGAISNSSTPEEKRAAIEKFKPILNDYLTSLAVATDLTLEELTLAKDVNYGTINYDYRASGLPPEEGNAYVQEIVLPFYEAQTNTLRDFAKKNPQHLAAVDGLLSSVKTDIHYCVNYNLDQSTIECARRTSALFFTPDEIDSLEKFQNAVNDSNPLFSLVLIEEQKELLKELVNRAVNNLSADESEKHLASARALLNLHEKYANVLEKSGDKLLTDGQIQQTKKWMQTELAIPLFDNVIPFYNAIYSGKPQTNDTDLAVEMGGIIDSLGQNRVELGNLFLEKLEAHCAANNPPERFRLESYRLLIHLAPDPVKLDFVVEDLENILVNQRDPITTSPKVSAALGALLFSATRHEVLSPSSTEGSQTTAMLSLLLSNSIDPAATNPPLLPPHQLLTKIYRAGIANDALVGFPELKGAEFGALLEIQKTCHQTTLLLVADLINGCPRDLNNERTATTVTMISPPERWGKGVIARPETKDTAEIERFASATRNLFRLGDLGAIELSRVPAGVSHGELLKHMVRVVDMTEYLNFVHNPTADRITANVKESFPYLSTRSTGAGPFEHALLRVQSIQYQQVHHRETPAPPPHDDILARAQWRDKKIDGLAVRYANTAQEQFFCDLAITLIADSKERRPIESHQVLSDLRIQKEIARIFAQYGVIDHIGYEKQPNGQKLEQNSLATILMAVEPEQMKDALIARSAYLRSQQLEMLETIGANK